MVGAAARMSSLPRCEAPERNSPASVSGAFSIPSTTVVTGRRSPEATRELSCRRTRGKRARWSVTTKPRTERRSGTARARSSGTDADAPEVSLIRPHRTARPCGRSLPMSVASCVRRVGGVGSNQHNALISALG